MPIALCLNIEVEARALQLVGLPILAVQLLHVRFLVFIFVCKIELYGSEYLVHN
jgi:hypothetical protein